MNGETSLAPVNELKTEYAVLAGRASDLVVKDQESLDFATVFIRRVRAIADKVRETFEPMKKKAFEAHRAIVAEERKFLDTLEAEERIAKNKVVAYTSEQDRIRLQAEREAFLAVKKAEKVAEVAIDKAHDLVAVGDIDEANEVLTEAKKNIDTIEAPVVPEKPVVEGIRFREVWKWEVTNLDIIPETYLVKVVNKDHIDGVVKRLKDHTAIPGVRVWSEKIAVTMRNGK